MTAATAMIREPLPGQHGVWRDREVKRSNYCLCGAVKLPGYYLCGECVRTCPRHLLFLAGKDKSVKRRCINIQLDHAWNRRKK